MIAIATLGSLIINRHKLPELAKIDLKPAFWLILIVLNAYFVSILFAVDQAKSLDKSVEWTKILVNFFVMIFIIRSYKDYRMLIWVILLCVANWGFISYEVGSNRDIGVIAPNATEENAIAAHVVTILPFFGVYFLQGKKWEKLFIILAIPFCLNIMILANSRGAFLALLVISAAVIFLTRGKIRFAVIVGLILGSVVFLQLTNEQFWKRQDSTFNRIEENRPEPRYFIWQGAIKMMTEHPLLGVGLGNYQPLSQRYTGNNLSERIVAHNNFFHIGGEAGLGGLMLYCGLLILTLVAAFKLSRSPIAWFRMWGHIIELSMIAYLVVGTFISRHNFVLAYMIMGLAAAKAQSLKQFEAAEKAVQSQPAASEFT